MNVPISMITVDEAHCIYHSGGQDFSTELSKYFGFGGTTPKRPVVRCVYSNRNRCCSVGYYEHIKIKKSCTYRDRI